MKFSKNNVPITSIQDAGDILNSDQIEWLTDPLALVLHEAEKRFNFTFTADDTLAIIQKTIAKKENPPGLSTATVSTAKFLQSATDNQRFENALQYIIDALEDNGKLDMLEGAIAAIKMNRALKDAKSVS